jgi:hypothetical protein
VTMIYHLQSTPGIAALARESVGVGVSLADIQRALDCRCARYLLRAAVLPAPTILWTWPLNASIPTHVLTWCPLREARALPLGDSIGRACNLRALFPAQSPLT